MTLMKSAAASALALFVAVSYLPGDTGDVTKTLLKLELDWAGAVERNDVDAIGRLLHRDFTFTSPTGAMMELEYAPGAGTLPHSHPGPAAGYVLEGAIESQIEGGRLTTYRRGETFFEPARGKHLVSRNASQIMPVRFLTYFLTPKDEPLVIPEHGGRRTTAPEYDAKGNLKLPTDFRTWVFVGSNLGLGYRKDAAETTRREQQRHRDSKVGDFHNIYINPEAYEHYLKTKKFPEKTVLVMDVYESKEKEPQNIVSRGYFPGKQLQVEVAVKNSNHPDGSKTDWAYYAFEDPAKPKPAKAFEDADCYQCHKQHADDDNVWVQFYPILRGQKKSRDK